MKKKIIDNSREIQHRRFRIIDLFEINTPKLRINANTVTIYNYKRGFPYVVRTSQNNGIRGYIEFDEQYLNPANTISFGQDTATMFYQDTPYFTGDKVKILTLKNEKLNHKIASYLLTCMRKAFSLFSWGQSKFEVSIIGSIEFELPIVTDKNNLPTIDRQHKYHPDGYIPDWNYMQEHISELEQKCIRELEFYLKTTGLNSFMLTDEDQKILSSISKITRSADRTTVAEDRKEMREFRLGDLFDKRTMKGYPKVKENLVENPAGYHVFGQNIQWQHHQKILIDERYLHRVDPEYPILAYTSSVGEIGIIDESFYRSGDNGAFQGLFPKAHKCNTFETLYILSVLRKHFAEFGYTTGMADVIDLQFMLPILTDAIGQPVIDSTKKYHPEGFIPDWDYMSAYIRAVEKLVIKDVIKYKDEIMEERKSALS